LLTAGGIFASTSRGCRVELCKAVVLAHGALCGKPFACKRATDEHAAAAAASRGRGRLLPSGIDRAAEGACPGGVCASPVLRRAGAFSRRRGSLVSVFLFPSAARLGLCGSGSTGAGRPFAMFCVCMMECANVPLHARGVRVRFFSGCVCV